MREMGGCDYCGSGGWREGRWEDVTIAILA